MRKPMHTTDEIIEHFGGRSKIAEVLRVTPASISMWQGFVPETRAFEIMVRSHWKFTVDRMPLRRPIPYTPPTTIQAA
jgi:hypothetical protein